MIQIAARNVNSALPQGVEIVRNLGRPVTVRGRLTLEVPKPVATTTYAPLERVLFDPARDANPFFHLMEALWMLAGRDDVKWLARFLRGIREFSDDGIRFHGAYGHRLRVFRGDQLTTAVRMLRAAPNTRRAVLQIWDAPTDLNANSADIPCNDLIFLKVRDEALNMTVCCRSNDMLWGAYGANTVQFGTLMEYLAARLRCAPGKLVQVSDSFHVYPETPAWSRLSRTLGDKSRTPYHWLYVTEGLRPEPMVTHPEEFDEELREWFNGSVGPYRNLFLVRTATPVADAHAAFRNGDLETAMMIAQDIYADDWRLACTQWLERRITRRARKEETHAG